MKTPIAALAASLCLVLAMAGACSDNVGPSMAGKGGPRGPVSSAASGSLEGAVPVGPPLFSDDFERGEIGPGWVNPEGGPYVIEGGALRIKGAYNKPLWLATPLPDDVIVELEAWSRSSDGDVKIEIFGDGAKHESGYIVIFGGWSNSITTIAKLDEHEVARVEMHDKMAIGKRYRWKIVRIGDVMEFYADDILKISRRDPAMLRGPGHDRLAINNWASDSYYDNVKVYAAKLPAAGASATGAPGSSVPRGPMAPGTPRTSAAAAAARSMMTMSASATGTPVTATAGTTATSVATATAAP